jgi:hypothetical protein
LLVGLALTSAASGTMVRQEWHTGVAGSRQAIINFLQDLVNPVPVPNVEVIQDTSAFVGSRDNYVAKFYGWVTVPETGTYQFHYACDDYGMLYVSQDENMENAVEVAYVDGWTAVAEWNKYASQHSAPMELKKGQIMAVMAFFQEAGGGDNMDLGWTGPGLSSSITAPTYLTNYITHIPPTPSKAKSPVPEDGTVDVPLDAAISWGAGKFAATHDVYLGTVFDDVNDASRANPKGVLISQGQADATFDLDGVIEYGQTYFWRIDEVNAPPTNTIFKGKIWSFTAEPFAYPVTGITATASSAQPGMSAQNAVNGSGLNAADQHSTTETTMWMTSGAQPAWIQFEFAKVEKLHEMWVWNSNQMIEAFLGFGAKSVKVEYSADGETWTELADVPEFAKATAAATYTANTTVSFSGVLAKFVKLTINSNWGGVVPQTGLAEVRFFQVPVQARLPVPADGTTGVSVNSTFDWRPGREATSHKVFFGADEAAVADGTAAAQTVTDHSFTPAAMNFGTQYFWKVDEIGGDGPYAGNIWSFVSQEFAAIDDFEAYNDDDNRIYDSWIDGVTTGASGSTVGYMQAPFAEKTVIHGGKQSLPLAYDNSQSPFVSEAELEFATAQNWTGSGATELAVWTQGYPAPTAVAVSETGGKMTLTGAGADIWNNSDEFTYAYKTLTGDGVMIARVVSNGTGTNTWAKGGVMIRDSLNGGSTHAMMVITGGGGNGASFQYRPVADAASANADSTTVVAPPYWVKIERQGDTFIGSFSADGKTWSQVGQTMITMEAPVYIGICVTSHVAGTDRTFQFDGISATGGVSGSWQGAVIDSPTYNDRADMYLIVEDSAGKTARATSATAVTAAEWTRWVIPMSDLAGVNFTKVKKLTIGVGNKAAPVKGGAGTVFIDDIGYGRPVPTP